MRLFMESSHQSSKNVVKVHSQLDANPGLHYPFIQESVAVHV